MSTFSYFFTFTLVSYSTSTVNEERSASLKHKLIHLDAFNHEYFFPSMTESWWIITHYRIRTMILYHIVKHNIKISTMTVRIATEPLFAMPCTECNTECSQSLSPSSLAVNSLSVFKTLSLTRNKVFASTAWMKYNRNRLFFPIFSIISFPKCQKQHCHICRVSNTVLRCRQLVSGYSQVFPETQQKPSLKGYWHHNIW